MSEIPSGDIKESLYKFKIRESDQLKSVPELFEMEIHQKISMLYFLKLKTMARRSKYQKLRLRNFDARHGRIESGAVVKNPKGLSGVEGGKGFCYQWNEKGLCSRRNQCSFRHEAQDRAQNSERTVATLSEPTVSRGRSASRKRSIRGKSNHGSILRQPCRFYLKGTCMRTLCEFWHPPECQFYKNETGCKAGDKCLFPHFMVDEQPKKKPKKSNFTPKKKRRQECCCCCEKCITIGLCITRFGCLRF